MASVCRKRRPLASSRDGPVSGDAVLDAVVVAADDLVEHAADLARVARDFGHALLVVVEFLQRHDRQEDIVLLEAVDRLVGSCIRTLVSRTKSLALVRVRAGAVSGGGGAICGQESAGRQADKHRH
jgi:hypothetical protein